MHRSRNAVTPATLKLRLSRRNIRTFVGSYVSDWNRRCETDRPAEDDEQRMNYE
jgi:hypothetical protein